MAVNKQEIRPRKKGSNRTAKLWLLSVLSLAALLLLAACASRPPAAGMASHEAAGTTADASSPVSGSPAASVVDVRQVRRALTSDEAKDYLGDAVCASCHPDIAARHARSRHAQTLRPVTLAHDGAFFRASNAVVDDHLHYTYTTRVAQGKCLMQGRNRQGKTSELSADWVMGSGHNALTYLNSEHPTEWVELRISRYPKVKVWDYTPTQLPGANMTRAAGQSQSDGSLTGCLLCHVTTLRLASSPPGPDGLPSPHPNPDMQASLLGVGCERCHGPGKAHVAQATQAGASTPQAIAQAKSTRQTFGMEDLARATPERINALCGACHRTPENAAAGDSHVEINVPRFQGAALARSACYQKSGTLSCLTCHDSHANADPSLARNDAICLRCHSGKSGQGDKEKGRQGEGENLAAQHRISNTVCPVNPKSDCTRCHMPKQAIADIPHVQYTNHWIKAWPNTAATSSISIR